MVIKDGVSLSGLRWQMINMLSVIETTYIVIGRRPEGVTITSGLDGEHKEGSLHYEGLALDLRTRYFSEERKIEVYEALKLNLEFAGFDVVLEDTHIHVEYDYRKGV